MAKHATYAMLMLALSAPLGAIEAASVLLSDGRVLTAESISREGNLYLLEQRPDFIIPVPISLVREVRLGGSQSSADESAPAQGPAPEMRVDPLGGLTYGRPSQTVAGDELRAPAVFSPEPQVLAGEEVRLPTRSEQLEVFGEPARFQRSVIDPYYAISGDWDFSDPERSNNFNRVRWSEARGDPAFTPTSDWNSDPRSGNNWKPSVWSRGPVDPTWIPEQQFPR
jgi:hypothetical protein